MADVAVPPTPEAHPVPEGTAVRLDPLARFPDAALVAGGSPWRLLRLGPRAAELALEWSYGGEVGPGEGAFARTLVGQGLLTPTYPAEIPLDELDIVVPVYEDAENLARLLPSLNGLSVIVVDDGSPHGADIAAVAERCNARLVVSPENGGPGHARNLGLAAARRPYVAFLDADVYLVGAAASLRSLLAHFTDPLVAAVAPRVTGLEGPRRRDVFEARSGPLDLGAHSALVAPRGRVSYVPSACLLVRRDAVGDGFDESLRVGEDVDLVWRLGEAGWLVRYDASVVVHHNPRSTWSDWLAQRYRYGTSAGELARRHPGSLHPLRTDAWTLLAWLAVLARRPRLALTVTALARQQMIERLPAGVRDPEGAATTIVVRGIAEAGGPLARATVRSYLPLLVVGILFRPTRLAALAVTAVGVAWRWRGVRHVSVPDVALGIADDAAYSAGLWRGAVGARSAEAVVPRVSFATTGLWNGLREALVARD